VVQAEYDRLEELTDTAKSRIEAMSSHPANKSRIYVTSAEILQLKSVGTDTVFAVTAPQGTTLSVPNPQEVPEGFRYKCASTLVFSTSLLEGGGGHRKVKPES
jgi:hypothetical protein